MLTLILFFFFFFFNDTAPTEISPLSLHDALPIFIQGHRLPRQGQGLDRIDHHRQLVRPGHVAAGDDRPRMRPVGDAAGVERDRRLLPRGIPHGDRKSTRLNSSHGYTSYAVFCLKKRDSGVTGRKIIVDTYGGMGHHGGGAFSGKDPSKVDRSAAYAARWVAKNVVAAGLARRCEVQVAYAIGVAEPVSIMVETFGTHTVPEEKIEKAVRATFSLKPASIIRELDLLRPIYEKTAAYGHFGRNEPEFTWERTDRADALRQAPGPKGAAWCSWGHHGMVSPTGRL